MNLIQMNSQKSNKLVKRNDTRGKVLVSEVNTLLGLTIDDNGVDTIGGWILTKI